MQAVAEADVRPVGHTTREVADLLGFSVGQVRQFVKRGLVEPTRGERGEHRFSFPDVVLLRMAKRLMDDNVPPRRAFATLAKLKHERGGRPLASVRILSQGNQVVVRDAATLWNVDTGQGHLDFEAAGVASPAVAEERPASNVAQVAHLADRRHLPPGQTPADFGADEWYDLGVQLEEMDPPSAPGAYARAIALDAQHADAHVNLGRLYQLQGDLRRAKRHYQLALAAAPEHPLANYNMGTVFDELEETDSAATYYRHAANVPDAHYNLARIFELRGDEVSSLRHLRKYRQLLDGAER